MNRTALFLCLVFFFIPIFRAEGARAKQVFVHYLPWYDSTGVNYPSRTGWCLPDNGLYDCSDTSITHYTNSPLLGEYSLFDDDVLEYHLLLIRVTGIDGIIININPANGMQKDGALALLTKLVSMKAAFGNMDLSIIVSYDNDSTDQALITQYLTWVYDNIYNNPALSALVFRDDETGHPVFMTWSESDRDHYRTEIQSLFSGNVLHLVRNAVAYDKSDGNFEWVNNFNPDATLTDMQNWGQQYFDDFDYLMARQSSIGISAGDVNDVKMGGVYPGFDDVNVPPSWNGGTRRYILRDVNDGNVMSLTWEKQIDYFPNRLGGTDQVENPWVQITTWNDWPEGTSIEPATDSTYGYTALETTHAKISEFKSAGTAFQIECLVVPFEVYTERKAGENSVADQRVTSTLTGICPMPTATPTTTTTPTPISTTGGGTTGTTGSDSSSTGDTGSTTNVEPSSTPTPSTSPAASPSVSATPSSTPSASATSSATPTSTPTPSVTPSPSPFCICTCPLLQSSIIGQTQFNNLCEKMVLQMTSFLTEFICRKEVENLCNSIFSDVIGDEAANGISSIFQNLLRN